MPDSLLREPFDDDVEEEVLECEDHISEKSESDSDFAEERRATGPAGQTHEHWLSNRNMNTTQGLKHIQYLPWKLQTMIQRSDQINWADAFPWN